ncbi:beta-1,4-galactosyltransferase 3-like [Paramacrobiotus metropolitanus]|uniref:beta-1,4-galactosyltransferase 3-like n=1 Tax=Paramacrobiotus metropolitanus TaxID=2943436 RepID=UPI002445626C|nr:beta-1,4-galactosyltransferase 3-like [Paramacrobiotus metropolitanus]
MISATGSVPVCEAKPSTLMGRRNISQEIKSDKEIVAENPHVEHGGSYRPKHCVQRGRMKVAVLVAYRSRTEHLQILLNNLHPFLQRQQLDYTIFVAEQSGNATFNRGKLFNTGFQEVNKLSGYSCFVFHDVDLLPENDHNSYFCPTIPTLLASVMDKNQYKPFYDTYFGSEDDDLGERVRTKLGKPGRVPFDIGQYTMIKHGRDSGNPFNPKGQELAKNATQRMETDGLSNVHYTILQSELRPLYTWMLVDLGAPP